MARRNLSIWLAAVAALLLSGGCGTERTTAQATNETGAACSADADCKSGRICAEKQCIAPGDATGDTSNGDDGAAAAANSAPVAQGGNETTQVDTILRGVLVATDADGDTLSYEIVTNAIGGSAVIDNAASGAYTYIPNSGYAGTDQFTFRVTDGTDYSNVAIISITIEPPPIDPDAPSNLVATHISDNEIQLTWADNSTSEQGFRIERKANEESSFSELTVVGAGAISYADTSVVANSRYTYRVLAVRAAGDTDPSNEAVAYTTPVPPGGLSMQQMAVDTVELSWADNAAYEQSYRIERKTDATSFQMVGTLAPGATAYTDSGLAIWETYTWRVVAIAAGLEASAEDGIQVTPASGPSWPLPSTSPTNLTDNVNGTVSDNVTGLMWQREDDNNTYTWQGAIDYCAGLSLAGHSDWRLPNRHELQSIVDYGTRSPAINGTLFPGTASSSYWSSSSYANDASSAWHVGFSNGNVSNGSKTNYNYARCVRP